MTAVRRPNRHPSSVKVSRASGGAVPDTTSLLRTAAARLGRLALLGTCLIGFGAAGLGCMMDIEESVGEHAEPGAYGHDEGELGSEGSELAIDGEDRPLEADAPMAPDQASGEASGFGIGSEQAAGETSEPRPEPWMLPLKKSDPRPDPWIGANDSQQR